MSWTYSAAYSTILVPTICGNFIPISEIAPIKVDSNKLHLRINLFRAVESLGGPLGGAGAPCRWGGVWQCYTPPTLLKSVLLF
jgi:hypothetical protein